MFVLKEAYSKPGAIDWNEVAWFVYQRCGKIGSKTWRKLLDWLAVIFDEDRGDYVWENPLFKKMALINIKKYDGVSKSNDDDLKKHAILHSKLIYEQIKKINPTIIVCGYTGWLLDIVWEKEVKSIIRKNRCGSRVYRVPELSNTVMIDFWHPSCLVNHDDEFANDVKEAKQLLVGCRQDDCGDEENVSKDD